MSGDGTTAASKYSSPAPGPRKERSQGHFEGLVEAHLGWLQGWLRGRLQDEALVEDLSQEAFLRAFRNFPRLRDPDRFGAWLYRTAQNLVRDDLRRRSRQKTKLVPTETLDLREHEAETDAERVARRETAECVLETIRSLPARYRDPLLLCHAEDLSYEEIGRILGIRPEVLRVRLCRARKNAPRTSGELDRRSIELSNRRMNAKRTSCSDVEVLISVAVDGEELTREEDALLESHLRECAWCRALRVAESTRSQLLREELGRRSDGQSVLARTIVSRADPASQASLDSASRGLLARYGWLAAACVLVLGGVSFVPQLLQRTVPEQEDAASARTFIPLAPSEILFVGERIDGDVVPGLDGVPVQRREVSEKLILRQVFEASEASSTPEFEITPAVQPVRGELLLDLERTQTDFPRAPGWAYQ